MDIKANKPNQKKNMIMSPPTTYTVHIKNNKEAKVNNLNIHDNAPTNHAQII